MRHQRHQCHLAIATVTGHQIRTLIVTDYSPIIESEVTKTRNDDKLEELLGDECQEELKNESFPVTNANLEVQSISLLLLHQRLTHFNYDDLEKMERQGMLHTTIIGNKTARKLKCDVCSCVKAIKNNPPEKSS